MNDAERASWETSDAARTRDVYVVVEIPERDALEFYGTYPLVEGMTEPRAELAAFDSVAEKLVAMGCADGATMTEVRTRTRHPMMRVPRDDWWTHVHLERIPLAPFVEGVSARR